MSASKPSTDRWEIIPASREIQRLILSFVLPKHVIEEPKAWVAYKAQTHTPIHQELQAVDVIRHNFFDFVFSQASSLTSSAIKVVNTAAMAQAIDEEMRSPQPRILYVGHTDHKLAWNHALMACVARIGRSSASSGSDVDLFRELLDIDCTSKHELDPTLFAYAVEHDALYVVRYMLGKFVQRRIRDSSLSLDCLCDHIQAKWMTKRCVEEILAISRLYEHEALIKARTKETTSHIPEFTLRLLGRMINSFRLFERWDLQAIIDFDEYPILRDYPMSVQCDQRSHEPAQFYAAARAGNAKLLAEIEAKASYAKYREWFALEIGYDTVEILRHFYMRKSAFFFQLVDALGSPLVLDAYMGESEELHDYELRMQLQGLRANNPKLDSKSPSNEGCKGKSIQIDC